nr:hypothetical protein [Tanacetum cinerariifolium]
MECGFVSHLVMILEKSSLHKEIHKVDHHEVGVFGDSSKPCEMFGEFSCSCVDGILVDGASWSIDVDTRESAKSTALGAASTGTGETTIDGGVMYSLNIGFDPQLQVEHFNPLGDNTGVLEYDVLDDSTCLMLLEYVRGAKGSKSNLNMPETIV